MIKILLEGASQKESLKGMLENVNVWDSVLEGNEINELSKGAFLWGDLDQDH